MNPQSILDTSKPLNVELFDQVVKEFYSGSSNRQIHDLLAQFEQNPRAWTKAPDIIQKSNQIESKILALSILETCIKTRWNILPLQSKKGIKGFVESLVVKLSQDGNLKDIGPFLTKLNTVLIEIIKREWPHNWPGFITQVVEVSKRSEVVCANNMNLLRLLSEEAFENKSLHLSHRQVDNFKENLTKELSKVFELCMFVLKNSSDRRLIECTLNTLQKFLAIKWIPIPIVFSSQLIEALTLKYFNIQQYRVLTLQCLVEIGGIKSSEFDHVEGAANETVSKCNDKLVNMFLTILRKTFSDCGINMNTNIDVFINSGQYNYQFIQTYTNFLFNFVRYHHKVLEEYNNGSRDGLKAALTLLLNISDANNSTLFAICCDLWEYLVRDLQKSLPKKSILNSTFSTNSFLSSSSSSSSSSGNAYDISCPRYQLYKDALHELKKILMRRLPRPKEVLVVKDDNGSVVKQEMKDTFMLTLHKHEEDIDAQIAASKEVLVVKDDNGSVVKQEMKDTFMLTLHKQMSKILYMLSSIDPSDTRTVIGEKLTQFSKNQEAKRNKYGGSMGGQSDVEENQFFAELNSLCWSIGAVAGSMPPDVEKSFLVVVIKILLSLCEVQQSKNAKAIIASCIMYVVRKYPRFLKKHWKFLQTVVRKLIEFLAEKHPGVQDMSIETLNEICQKCGQKFLKIQENDQDIFLYELINGIDNMCIKLDTEQIENLYATWAVVISHEHRDFKQASNFVEQLLTIPNQRYQQLLTMCQTNQDLFNNEENIEKYIHLIRIYKGVCLNCSGDRQHCNGSFLKQFSNLYASLIKLYTGYAQLMNAWYTNSANANITRSAAPQIIKLMSMLKAEILQLFEIFVAKSRTAHHDQIVSEFVPNFLNAILTDYQNCTNIYKEYSCLNVCSALIEHLDSKMNSFIPKIFGTLFQITLDMIKESMDNYPDHRLAFFKFLYHVNKSCFNVFEQMNKTQMQLVINCIMWAHEHIDPQICEYGVKTLNQFLAHIRQITERSSNGSLITMFYQNFLFLILEKLIHVMTDTLHKSSFPSMCWTL
eukprot:CAMPEP_0197071980 /NCGR_PEP_ID=MMETSP1384-20130603/209866_1 /TAXON_ID=29189 /ORGANISM="Ammonia sp." /LENGTH=1045 /DNA_ID=CAMNT_0042510793 /DNA_START=117 /DNA_END=3251 /DNA_ORIENTATION=-